MFKIVALVYIMIAGHPVVDAPDAFTIPESFKDLETCQGFLKSPEFADRRTQLSRFITATVSRSEAAKAAEAEEEMPVFDTAITASCVDDDRI